MRAASIVVLIGLTALSACGQVQTGGGISPATATEVEVTVSGTAISVDPDPAPVGEHNGVIKWTLRNSGSCTYTFPNQGITFSWPTGVPPSGFGCIGVGDWNTRFNNCRPNPSGSEFHCNVVGRPVKDLCYYYSITLVSAQGGCTSPLMQDPWAKNK